MNRGLEEAIADYNHELKKLNEILADDRERDFRSELNGNWTAIRDLAERIEQIVTSKDYRDDNGIGEMLLLSTKTHTLTFDIMYEIVDHIRKIDDKLGIEKEERLTE